MKESRYNEDKCGRGEVGWGERERERASKSKKEDKRKTKEQVKEAREDGEGNNEIDWEKLIKKIWEIENRDRRINKDRKYIGKKESGVGK